MKQTATIINTEIKDVIKITLQSGEVINIDSSEENNISITYKKDSEESNLYGYGDVDISINIDTESNESYIDFPNEYARSKK